MKKIALGVASWPVLVLVGWLATKLSERYEAALDGLQYEFDFE